MALESATYINQLVVTNPVASDPKSQGDDHLRLLKSTLQATFPNVAGAVTPTHVEFGYLAGVTGGVQTQLNAKAPLASPALTGTPTAPTAAALTNNAQIANTAYADGAVAAEAALRVAADALKATRAGDSYSGTHDFSGAARVKVPTPIGGSDAATKAYADAITLSAALPGQDASTRGKVPVSDGSTASWGSVAGATLFSQIASGGF